jgi:DNA-binding CsgD family transcriptional regulator
MTLEQTLQNEIEQFKKWLEGPIDEIADRLEGNENYISTQVRILDYLVLHNNEPGIAQ